MMRLVRGISLQRQLQDLDLYRASSGVVFEKVSCVDRITSAAKCTWSYFTFPPSGTSRWRSIGDKKISTACFVSDQSACLSRRPFSVPFTSANQWAFSTNQAASLCPVTNHHFRLTSQRARSRSPIGALRALFQRPISVPSQVTVQRAFSNDQPACYVYQPFSVPVPSTNQQALFCTDQPAYLFR